jgi:putative transposon-encoded protein
MLYHKNTYSVCLINVVNMELRLKEKLNISYKKTATLLCGCFRIYIVM